ncbi:MAG: DUF3817 domain-containing protein [Bdellovibrionota bacterium]
MVPLNNLDLKYFRILALAEGSSLLVLMFIAMPLKRIFGYPEAVKIVGSIHGILFLMYMYTLLTIVINHKWPAKKTLLAVIMSSIPFGSFWFDRKYLVNS